MRSEENNALFKEQIRILSEIGERIEHNNRMAYNLKRKLLHEAETQINNLPEVKAYSDEAAEMRDQRNQLQECVISPGMVFWVGNSEDFQIGVVVNVAYPYFDVKFPNRGRRLESWRIDRLLSDDIRLVEDMSEIPKKFRRKVENYIVQLRTEHWK